MSSAKSVTISPSGVVEGTIRPPGSKSITNRAIVCASLASGESLLEGVLDCEDTQVMIAAWRQLGLTVQHDAASRKLAIAGCAGRLPNRNAELYLANSGTSIRFLTAALAACHGEFKLDGIERMRERPIEDLLLALEQLGVKTERLNAKNPGCPPIKVLAEGFKKTKASIRGNISSQFLSGLMQAAPLADENITLDIEGELVSVPYVEMTAEVMKSFGADVQLDIPKSIVVSGAAKYQGTNYSIEPDASAASYFWAAAALTKGTVTVEGLSKASLQGDVRFVEVLEKMGCSLEHSARGITVSGTGTLRGIDVDMGDMSDTVQTLASVALFAEGPTCVRNIAHNRVKETDRITDLATELRKVGAQVEEFEDGFTLFPPEMVHPARVSTYDDHRMAMSLALIGLRVDGIEVENPGCTAKTYPDYWEDLSELTSCGIRWSD